MSALSEELASTDNRTGVARQTHNNRVLGFNDAATQRPAAILARLFTFLSQSMLASTTSEAERAPVKVARWRVDLAPTRHRVSTRC